MAINTNQSSSQNRPSTLNEALRILDEALAGDHANLGELVGDQYQHLKSAIGSAGEQASDVATNAYRQISSQVSDFASRSVESGKKVYYQVDSTVRSNPWPVLGGIAVGTFALGFLMGKSRNSASVQQ